MTECVLCHKTLGPGTKPRTIIDWETVEIKGQAHTGCLNKAKLERSYNPEHWPSEPQLLFAAKLRAAIEQIKKEKEGGPYKRIPFSKYLLAYEGLFKFANAVQWANSRRVKKMMDHWLNGPHIITQEQHDELREWMLSIETSEKRIKEGPK